MKTQLATVLILALLATLACVAPASAQESDGESCVVCVPDDGTTNWMDIGGVLESVDGSVLEDITVTNLTMRDVTNSPLFLRLGNRARPFVPNGARPGIGAFRNVTISNLVATDVGGIGCAIAFVPLWFATRWRGVVTHTRALTDIAFAVDSILAAIALVGGSPNEFGVHPKLWVVLTGGTSISWRRPVVAARVQPQLSLDGRRGVESASRFGWRLARCWVLRARTKVPPQAVYGPGPSPRTNRRAPCTATGWPCSNSTSWRASSRSMREGLPEP